MANDTPIFLTLVCILLGIGILVPIVNSVFGSVTSASQNIDETISGVDIESESSITLTGFSIILNVVSVAFWTFGLPLWINLTLLLVMRIAVIYLALRLIRGQS